MINRLVIVSAVAGMSIAAFAAGGSRGATEAWVARYVSNTTARATVSTNGNTVITSGPLSIEIEPSTVYAIRVREPSQSAISAGLTNGYTLVWDGSAGAYINGQTAMEATPSNIVFTAGGVTYTTRDEAGQTWLSATNATRFCRLVSTKLQPSQAAAIRGGE